MKPLTKRCAEMLAAVEREGDCKFFVRSQEWTVGAERFHSFTGGALLRRGLLEHYVDRYDGSLFDRYRPTCNGKRSVSK